MNTLEYFANTISPTAAVMFLAIAMYHLSKKNWIVAALAGMFVATFIAITVIFG